LVEPRGLGILGEKRTMYAGEDGHRSILARRSRGSGEGLRDLACHIQHGQITGHSKLLTRRDEMEPLRKSEGPAGLIPSVAVEDHTHAGIPPLSADLVPFTHKDTV